MQRLMALSRSPRRIDPEGLILRTSASHFARNPLACPPLPAIPPDEVSAPAGPATAKLRNPTNINFRIDDSFLERPQTIAQRAR
jgi:hypothetical protein